MSETTAPATYSLWTDETLTSKQRSALMEVENTSEARVRALKSIRDMAIADLDSIARGVTAYGIAPQRLIEAATTETAQQAAIKLAMFLEVDSDKIVACATAR